MSDGYSADTFDRALAELALCAGDLGVAGRRLRAQGHDVGDDFLERLLAGLRGWMDTIAEHDTAIRFPFQFAHDYPTPRPVLPVRIFDKAERGVVVEELALVDSGADCSTLPPRLLDAIGLERRELLHVDIQENDDLKARTNGLYVPGVLTEVAGLRIRLVGRFDAWRDFVVLGLADFFAAFRSVGVEDGHVVIDPRPGTFAGLYARPAKTVGMRRPGCEASGLALDFEAEARAT
jgi:hypothetical protein